MSTTKMKKLCEVCNIELDEHDFPNHVQGKRHLKNVEAENYKKTFLEKSIYVSRIPPGLTIDNMNNFFQQFGIIERSKLEQHFAIIQFKKKYINRITCIDLINGTTFCNLDCWDLKLPPHDFNPSDEVTEQDQETVLNLLNLCLSREPVNFLLSKPIFMGRHKLDIKKRKWNNPGPTSAKPIQNNPDKPANDIVFADLKTRLQAESTLDGEISTFLQTVQLSEEEVDKNWQAIHASLLEALKPAFPNCAILRFGSSITGLCFKGSDIDVYLDIGEPIHEDNEKKNGWTPRTIFKEVKFYIYKRKTIFESVVPIPKAKTPIIKFCHAPTATNCDISFKHGLGVINSQLIKQLLCLDVRLKPLMIIIKFWSKTFELSGCGKFTNYAIVMLIIFYLQQPETKMLPTIMDLQKDCEPVYHWNWQVNFNRGAKFPTSNNKSSVTELLAGFFEFYVKFPFAKKMISPLDGCAHSRADFAKVCTEKGGDVNYLGLDRPICLQDPIELDNNITSGVTGKALETFQSFCAVGVEVCDAALKQRDKPFLLNLFTTLPAPLDNQASQQITIYARATTCAVLPKNFATRDDIKDKEAFANNHWYALTQDLVEDALRRIFKMEVQRLKHDREAKQQKVAETSDVHTKDNEKIVLECSANYSVMSGRKAKSFCIDPTLSRIDKETMISDELLKKQMDDGVKPTKFDFTCTINREQNPLRLVLILRDRNSANKRFRPLATYLSAKLPSIIEKELIHIIQYKEYPSL